MKRIPNELQYTQTHEWVRVENDGKVTVGITEHAQKQLGDLIVVELPSPGTVVHASDEVCVLESVKATSEVYSPLSGTIIDVNEDLEEAPGLLNNDPYGDGWLFVLAPRDPEEFSELLDAEGYEEYIEIDEE